MDEKIEFVRQLDIIVNQFKDQPSNNEIFRLIEFLPERDDAFELVPIIFENAESDQVLCAGGRIVLSVISNKWDSMLPDEKYQFRQYLMNQLCTIPEVLVIHNQILKSISLIALKEVPDAWPDFFPSIILGEPPRFNLLADFLFKLKTAKSISHQRFEEIKEYISVYTKEIIDVINLYIEKEKKKDALNALSELIPFMSQESLLYTISLPLFQKFDKVLIKPLCESMLSPATSEENLIKFFNLLAEIPQNCEDVDMSPVIPVLSQYFELLENPETIETLHYIHQLLFLDEDTDSYEYWELLILTCYDDYRTSGSSQRYEIYQDVITELRNVVINNMCQPIDFQYFKEQGYLIDSLKFDQMQTILNALFNLSPSDVLAEMSNAFSEVIVDFYEPRFCSLVYSAACITSFANINAEFALGSLKYVYSVYVTGNLMASDLSAALLIYLAMRYLVVQKLTADSAAVAAQIAIEYLENESTQKISTQYLLTCARYFPQILVNILNIQVLSIESLPTGIYTSIAEAVAYVYSSQNNIICYNELIYQKWGSLGEENTFDYVRQLTSMTCMLLGLSKVNKQNALNVLQQILPKIQEITNNFLELLLQFYQLNGPQAKGRDDAKLITNCINNEMRLFKELKLLDCEWIIAAHGNLPLEMMSPDILPLCEMFIEESSTSDETIDLIRDQAINKALEIILDPSNDLIQGAIQSQTILLPKLINTLSLKRFEKITGDDIEALLKLLTCTSQQIVISTLLALYSIVHEAEKIGESNRASFFKTYLPAIICKLIGTACEQSHRFCFMELIQLSSYNINLIVTGNVNVNLFDDTDNITGMINLLSSELITRYPLISEEEAISISTMLMSQVSPEGFESMIVELVSKANITTVAETTKHLKIQKMKTALKSNQC